MHDLRSEFERYLIRLTCIRFEPAIHIHIGTSHAGNLEAILEHAAAYAPVNLSDSAQCDNGGIHVFHNESGATVLDDFRHRTVPPRDHRSTTGQRLSHYQPEWLTPVDGEQHASGITQEFVLLPPTYLTHEFNAIAMFVKQWL